MGPVGHHSWRTAGAPVSTKRRFLCPLGPASGNLKRRTGPPEAPEALTKRKGCCMLCRKDASSLLFGMVLGFAGLGCADSSPVMLGPSGLPNPRRFPFQAPRSVADAEVVPELRIPAARAGRFVDADAKNTVVSGSGQTPPPP